MCFVMAKQGYLTDQGLTLNGAHNMAHLMFITPLIESKDWGAKVTNSPVDLLPPFNGAPELVDVLIVLTGTWSDRGGLRV